MLAAGAKTSSSHGVSMVAHPFLTSFLDAKEISSSDYLPDGHAWCHDSSWHDAEVSGLSALVRSTTATRQMVTVVVHLSHGLGAGRRPKPGTDNQISILSECRYLWLRAPATKHKTPLKQQLSGVFYCQTHAARSRGAPDLLHTKEENLESTPLYGNEINLCQTAPAKKAAAAGGR